MLLTFEYRVVFVMATDGLPVEQPGFKLHANQDTRLRASNIVFIVLPTIFVLLRLVSRRIARAGYWVLNSLSLNQIGEITIFRGIVGRFPSSPRTTFLICSPSYQSTVLVTRRTFAIFTPDLVFSNSRWIWPPHIHTPTQ